MAAAHPTRRTDIADKVRARIDEEVGRVASLSRSGSLIAIGSAALLVEGLRSAFGWARDARERQLEWFNGSLGRGVLRLWPGARHAQRSGSRNRDGLEK